MFESQLGETGSTIVQFALALVAVIALIFLVAWLAKRLSGGRFGHVHGDEASMQVLDTLHIDAKRKLVLVRQGKLEHLLLIGGGSDEVVERSMIGGIPLAARVQATKQQEKPTEEEPLSRQTDRYRTSSRFSRSLSRKKDDDSETEKDVTGSTLGTLDRAATSVAATDATSPGETKAFGSLSNATAPALAEKSTPEKATLATAATEPTQKAAKRVDPPSLSSRVSEPENKTEPSLPQPSLHDEQDALQKSLDKALSDSLLDNDPPLESSAPAVKPPEPAATGGVDDLDLERELEAALELDAFEADPTNKTPPPVDLPPLPDLPALTDVGSENTPTKTPAAGDPTLDKTETVASAPGGSKPGSKSIPGKGKDAPFAADTKADTPKPKPKESEAKDPMEPSPTPDPLKSDNVGERKPDAGKAEVDFPPPIDIPVELSGRSDPPISVPIPSRGPAASATTLAKTDKTQPPIVASQTKPDDALDISAMLHPSGTKTETSSAKPETDSDVEISPDDLDGEMRRLLGEIAGEPDKK